MAKKAVLLSILYMCVAAVPARGAQFDPSRFSHAAKDSHAITLDLKVEAQITDASGLASARLFYKSPDRTVYLEKAMTGAGSPGRYSATIASSSLSPLGFGYYFEAAYSDGRSYRSADYSTVILVMPAAIKEMLYRDEPSGADVKVVEGELILKLDPSVSPSAAPDAINALTVRHSGRVLAIDNAARLVRLGISPGLDLKSVLADVEAQSSVAFAQPNVLYETVLTPNDPRLGDQWAVPMMRLLQAWDVTTGDVSVTVGVIDTGRDKNHPDLQGVFLPGYDFLDNDPDPDDVGGHGTMVSGVIAAIGNNKVGVAGTNWKCRILPYRTGDFYLSTWAIIQSIRAAADAGARVINMSFGSMAGNQAEHDALKYAYAKGVVLVAAAGNAGTAYRQYPAAYPEVIAVVATNAADKKASFSSYGDWVDVSAPGQSILTTSKGGGYASVNGTSFASPYVAGVASLILSVNPLLKNDEVRQILRQTAVDLGSAGFDLTYGYGRIDAYAAVMAARQSSKDDTPPVVFHRAPMFVKPGMSAVIQAAVHDNVSVHSAGLYYRRQGQTNYVESPMRYLGADTFEGVIPKDYVAPPGVDYKIFARDPTGNETWTTAYLVPTEDVTPPNVQHTPAHSAEEGRAMTVTATITDDVGVAAASVFARVRGTPSYERYSMLPSGGAYQAVLPDTFARKPAVEYYFSASDAAGNSNATGNPATAASPHSVAIVYMDRISPVIAHAPVYNGRPSLTDVTVRATITDDIGVIAAFVMFRVAGASEYESAAMRVTSADIYEAAIPARVVIRPAVEYYIDARDAAGNAPPTGQTPGTLARPNTFIVAVDTVPPTIFHEALGSSPGELIDEMPAKVSAVALDNRGVRVVTMAHRIWGEPAFRARPMSFTVSNRHEATLSGPDVRAPGIEYSLTAGDTDGNETTWGPIRVPVYAKIAIPTVAGDTRAYWVPGIDGMLWADSAGGGFARMRLPHADTAKFAWSPDLTKLVMTGHAGDTWFVYVIERRDTVPAVYQVTAGSWTDLFPSWSADGKYLLFASNKNGDWDVFMKEWDGDGDGVPDTLGARMELSADSGSIQPGSGELLGVARLTLPRDGDIVRGQARVVGGAFAVVQADGLTQTPAESYRVESGEGDSPVVWTIRREVNNPGVILFDEELAAWDMGRMPPGRHTICLVVRGNRRETRSCAAVWVAGLSIGLKMDTADLPAGIPAFNADGWVRNDFGAPMADLPVTVRIDGLSDTRGVRTDTNGNFFSQMTTPPPGVYTIRASVTDSNGVFAETVASFGVYSRGAALALDVDSANIQPASAVRALGRLAFESGDPIVNREIAIEIVETLKRYFVLTDTAGYFTLTFQSPVEPNAYTLSARAIVDSRVVSADTPFYVLPPPIDVSEILSPPVTYIGAYVAVSGTAVYRATGQAVMSAQVTIEPSWIAATQKVNTDPAGRYIALIQAAATPGTFPVRVSATDGKVTGVNERMLTVLPLYGAGVPVKLEVSLKAVPDSTWRNKPVVLEGTVNYVYQNTRWAPDTAVVTLSIDSVAGTWTEVISASDHGVFRRTIPAPNIPDTYTARAAAIERFGLNADSTAGLVVRPLTLRLKTSLSDSVLPARWPTGPTVSGVVLYDETGDPVIGAVIRVKPQSLAASWPGVTDSAGRFSVQSEFGRTAAVERFVTEATDGLAFAWDTNDMRVDSDRIDITVVLDTDVVPASPLPGFGPGRFLLAVTRVSHPAGYPVYREGAARIRIYVDSTNAVILETTVRMSPIGPGSAAYVFETFAVPVPPSPGRRRASILVEDRYGEGSDSAPFDVYASDGGESFPPGLPFPPDTGAINPPPDTAPPPDTTMPPDTRVVAPPPDTAMPPDTRVVAPPPDTAMPPDTRVIAPPDTTVPPPDTVGAGVPTSPDTKIIVFTPALITAYAGDPVEIDGRAEYSTGGPVISGICRVFPAGSSSAMSDVPPTASGRFRFPWFPAPPSTGDYEVVVDDGKLIGRSPVRVAIIAKGQPAPWEPVLPPPPTDNLGRPVYDELYPVQSPDGKYIAYSRRRAGTADPLNLFISPSDSFAAVLQFTAEDAGDMFPAWSPDSKRIAFGSKRSGNYDIWIKEVDGNGDGSPDAGGTSRRVTTWEGEDNKPAWSPDGGFLAYHSDRAGNYDVYVRAADGSGEARRVTMSDAFDAYPHWSSDGKYIVYQSNRMGRITPGATSTGAASIGLVMDESGSISWDGFSRMVTSIHRFLDNLPAGYPVSVTKFADRVNYVRDFTEDKTMLRDAVGTRLFNGSTAMYDALMTSMSHLSPRSGTRFAVLLSDGEDNYSRATADDVIAYANANSIRIISVFVSGAFYRASPPNLRRIAESTGGKWVDVDGFDGVEGGMQAALSIINRLLVNFNIMYVPADGGEPKQLTDHIADDLHPSFSPDAKKIAFVSFRSGRGDIYVMKFDPDAPPALPEPVAPDTRVVVPPPDTQVIAPPDTQVIAPPDTESKRLKPTLSWKPSGMQGSETSVVFQLRNMSNNPRDVAAGVLIRPFIIDGSEYVDTVIFDTHDLGTLAAVDIRDVRLTVMTNNLWLSAKKSAHIVVELQIVQELNWPEKTIGVSARYHLVREKQVDRVESSGDPTGEPSAQTSTSGISGRYTVVTEIENPATSPVLINIEKPIPAGLNLAEAQLPGGAAVVVDAGGASVLRIRDMPLAPGETFAVRIGLESNNAGDADNQVSAFLQQPWNRTEQDLTSLPPRERRICGTVHAADSATVVTLFDVTASKPSKIAQVRANDSGEFAPPEIPDAVKDVVVRVERPDALPAFKRVSVSEGKMTHSLGTLFPDTVDSRTGRVHRVDDPSSRHEVSAGEGDKTTRIDVPAQAVAQPFFIAIKDPENLESIRSAAANSGVRLLSAKEFVLIDAQTGAELHDGFSKQIQIGLPLTGLQSGERASLAHYNASTGKFEPSPATVDPEKGEISADVEHFSIYVSLASPASASPAATFGDFSELLVYPNPYQAEYGTNKVIFENIPASSILTLYTVSGEKVIEIANDGADDINGSTRGSANAAHIGWGLTTKFGRPVASGMYLFLLKDSAGNTKRGRVGVIR